jgi:FtsP/CotA-like multicopper oxidase with cupredoxin domain
MFTTKTKWEPEMKSWKDKLALTAQRNRQEIVKAKLSRREMMRLGLLTAGGTLVVKAGLSARAFAQQGPGGGSGSGGGSGLTDVQGVDGQSPPITPWKVPMPRLTVLQTVLNNDPRNMEFGPPTGKTPVDGATRQVDHQYFSYNAATNTFGPGSQGSFIPQKFYELEMREDFIQLHPDLPGKTRFFCFHDDKGNARVPGPLIRAKYGEPVLVRFKNKLPSVSTPQDFGISEMTTHLHNGHTPSESDGNPVNFFNSINDPNAVNPKGFKDQHYPNVLAGFRDPAFGGAGNPNEALGSLWYHDHHLDFTAQNVYKGMFGCYNLFDNLDTGVPGTGLNLPCGLSANGDDLDCPIFFHDAVLDADAQLVFDLFDLDGILGDRFLANGQIQPFTNVAPQRYRFRLYAPGPSRWWEWSLYDGKQFWPFWQITTDGNLLPDAVQVNSVRIAVAERVDIIVDFGKIRAAGVQQLYFVNRAEQVNGRGPTGNTLTPGTPVLQVNITGNPPQGGDPSADPADPKLRRSSNSPPNIGMKLRDLPDMDFVALNALAATVPTRTWRFERGNGGWMVNGQFFDENRIDAAIPQSQPGQGEVWIIQNPGGAWRHPVHIHFEEHRMLARNGQPVLPATQLNGAIDYSRRDIINLQTNDEVKLFMRFRDMGHTSEPAYNRYVMHCHNVVHEDHAMMIRWDIV